MKRQIDINKIQDELGLYRTQTELAKVYGITKQALNSRLKSLNIKVEGINKYKVKKVGDVFFVFRKVGKNNYKLIGRFPEDCVKPLETDINHGQKEKEE